MRFVYDRKIFSGGVLYWDLHRDTLCSQFFARAKSDLAERLGWSPQKFEDATSNLEVGFVRRLIDFFK